MRCPAWRLESNWTSDESESREEIPDRSELGRLASSETIPFGFDIRYIKLTVRSADSSQVCPILQLLRIDRCYCCAYPRLEHVGSL
jgi:hypothetical protein